MVKIIKDVEEFTHKNLYTHEKKSYLQKKFYSVVLCAKDLCRRDLDLDIELFFLSIYNQKEKTVFTNLEDPNFSPTTLCKLFFLFMLYRSFVFKSISFIKTVKLMYYKKFLLPRLRPERRKLMDFAVRTIKP